MSYIMIRKRRRAMHVAFGLKNTCRILFWINEWVM